MSLRSMRRKIVLLSLSFCLLAASTGLRYHPTRAQGGCEGEFISVSPALNDLGTDEYIRIDGSPTGFVGGLYPEGLNDRPPRHEEAGVAISSQIVPKDEMGRVDPVNGKIGFVSIGMSNTRMEFQGFIDQISGDPSINPQLVVINGAQGGQVSNRWADSHGDPWTELFERLDKAGVAPLQVQVAWVKLAQVGVGDFPDKARSLQADIEAVSRHLKSFFPNLRIAYYSSRTRAYRYWEGLSPEPAAFEGGFAVKWMIEEQINGNPDLNFDPSLGQVVAPYLSWGPYLWIDGLNPRSDGLIWTQNDVRDDCIHPSSSGIHKVAAQLSDFFKTDATSKIWFMANSEVPNPTPTPQEYLLFIPFAGLPAIH